jgi:hypothetical protein
MPTSIFLSEVFTKYILPFLLVFTLVFALLEKSKLLGDGKKQINAVVALIVGLIAIGFAYSTHIINNMIGFLSVFGIIFFIFLLLYAFFASTKDGLSIHKGIIIAGGVVALIGVLVASLYFSGAWNWLTGNVFNQSWAGSLWTNILFIAVIIGAMILVLVGKGK